MGLKPVPTTPITVSELSVPEHYTKGSDHLTLTDDIDKSDFGRDVPLSEAAREALDAVCPDRGLIFGAHDLRNQLRKAAKGVLDEDRRCRFCEYDLEHARATQWGETGNLTGMAYNMGWRQVTTANRYVRPNHRAGEALVKTWARDLGMGKSGAQVSANGMPDSASFPQCEGEDSNLHGSYPTSTSS